MNEVVIYARHDDGFALQSMRSDTISRLYLEIGNDEQLEDWHDERIWDELDERIGLPQNRGKITDKGKTPLRSYLSSQMRLGRCFLVGDSAHIVPPTGAKGLNLAIADAVCLGSCLNFYGVEVPVFFSQIELALDPQRQDKLYININNVKNPSKFSLVFFRTVQRSNTTPCL